MCIRDRAVTLQSNTQLGKISTEAQVAGMMQQRPSTSDTSKLPEETEELFNNSCSSFGNLELSEALHVRCVIPATQATGVNLPRSVLLCKVIALSLIHI